MQNPAYDCFVNISPIKTPHASPEPFRNLYIQSLLFLSVLSFCYSPAWSGTVSCF